MFCVCSSTRPEKRRLLEIGGGEETKRRRGQEKKRGGGEEKERGGREKKERGGRKEEKRGGGEEKSRQACGKERRKKGGEERWQGRQRAEVHLPKNEVHLCRFPSEAHRG